MADLIALKLLCLVLLFIAGEAQAREIENDDGGSDYIVDASGEPIRVAFPLHDRYRVDILATGSSHPESTGLSIRPSLRIARDHSLAVDYPDEGIWWRLRHRWLETEVSFASRGTQWTDSIVSTLVDATYLRHADDSFIVVPGTGLRFPTPFDIAFEYSLLGVEFDPWASRLSAIDVADFAFLVDFLRDPTYGHRLAIGPVAAYEIGRSPSPSQTRWNHFFLPATGGRLVYQWESATGRQGLSTIAQCAAWGSLEDSQLHWQRLCRADAQFEWTVLAINDRPISLLWNAAFGERPGHAAGGANFFWQATIGLRFSRPDVP